MPQNELVEGLGLDEYQYGFVDEEAHVYRTKPGLDEGVVRQISKHKGGARVDARVPSESA